VLDEKKNILTSHGEHEENDARRNSNNGQSGTLISISISGSAPRREFLSSDLSGRLEFSRFPRASQPT